MSPDKAQVKKQLEFYFSDSNYRRDRFMQSEAKKHEGAFIPLKVLFTFKKLAALTTDPAVVQEAIADSELIELNKAKDALRRKHPLAKDDQDQLMKRTLVLAGLGSTTPTLEEVKQALEPIVKADQILYIDRKFFRRQFSGVVWIEFKSEQESLQVLQQIDQVTLLDHSPVAMVAFEYNALEKNAQIEFQKAIRAMLVANDVPNKPVTHFADALLPLWQQDTKLKPRLKLHEETKQLFLYFTQVDFAQQVQQQLEKSPVEMGDTTLRFELVMDAEAIATRPRREPRETNNKKRKFQDKENAAKTVHITGIGQKVRIEDIKDLVNKALHFDKLPFVAYDGLDRASLTIQDPAKADELFAKLNALDDQDKQLGGKQVQFHLLNVGDKLQVEIEYDRGLIIEFSVPEEAKELSRDDIKNTINEVLEVKQEGVKKEEDKFDGVAFIKYSMGESKGFLRTTSANATRQILKLIEAGQVEVNGIKLDEATLVTDEEEKAFWEDARKARADRFKQSRANKSNFNNNRHHHHHHKRQRN